MEEIKHTIGPLRTTPAPKGYIELIYSDDGNGFLFAECNPRNVGSRQAKLNAEFIVRACNSHYPLLNAAKDLLGKIPEGTNSPMINKLKAAIEMAEV